MTTTVSFGPPLPPGRPPVAPPEDGGDGRVPRLKKLFHSLGLTGQLWESGKLEAFVLTDRCVVPEHERGQA